MKTYATTKVRFLTNDNGEQVFVIDDGKAHVDGYEIELPHSLRSRFDIDPDLQSVESEPHTFQADENGEMIIGLNNRPLAEVSDVDITVEKTITMTHGSFTGAADPIPDDAVLSLILQSYIYKFPSTTSIPPPTNALQSRMLTLLRVRLALSEEIPPPFAAGIFP